MSLIEVNNLVKTYKTIEKEDGLLGYFKNLVKPKYKELTAVKSINFNIEKGELVGYIGGKGYGKNKREIFRGKGKNKRKWKRV